MRILLWHGYLLGGTGSNVYTRQLARAWSLAGHDVTVLSQDPAPERYDLGGASVVRPDAGDLLPVFVLDRYEGRDVRLIGDCSRAQLDRWVEANARAVREHLPADVVFCNHVLLGGPVGLATGAAYAVKAHGSELEYAMRGNPVLARWGSETLAPATATFVGSAHIRRVLEDVCGHVEHVHEVPPGVDVDDWHPQDRQAALEALLAEARQDPPNPGNSQERTPDEGNADRLARFLRDDRPTVVYFGKLMRNKGVHLLLEALEGLGARAVIVGFGEDRAALEGHAGQDVLFTGALEHRHLVHLLAFADACVVPSIFPEAFGMVAAEAAAAGCPPIVARHSGLAEIAAGLEDAYPEHLRHLAAFATGDASDLRSRLRELLALAPADRAAVRAAARAAVVERWSWTSVADRLLEPFWHG
jgi:glycosyltransferase involved in cell wall biosynthesis